jgi:hypothetical protein
MKPRIISIDLLEAVVLIKFNYLSENQYENMAFSPFITF